MSAGPARLGRRLDTMGSSWPIAPGPRVRSRGPYPRSAFELSPYRESRTSPWPARTTLAECSLPSASTVWRCSRPGGVRGSHEVHCRVTSSVGRPPPQPPWTPLRPVVPLPPARAGGSAGPGPAQQRGVTAGDPPRGRGLPPVDPHLEDLPRPVLRVQEAEGYPTERESPQPAGRPLGRQGRSDQAGPARRRGWFPHQRPARILAEYRRRFGTVHDFLTLNVFHQSLFVPVYRTKHAAKWLMYLKNVRGCILGTSGSI